MVIKIKIEITMINFVLNSVIDNKFLKFRNQIDKFYLMVKSSCDLLDTKYNSLILKGISCWS